MICVWNSKHSAMNRRIPETLALDKCTTSRISVSQICSNGKMQPNSLNTSNSRTFSFCVLFSEAVLASMA